MCILPNFEPSDLKTLKRKGKKEVKKAAAEKVELVVPEQPLLENPI
jgi:hypothetical protein